jgi:transcription initiation factor IIE alpha subunit
MFVALSLVRGNQSEEDYELIYKIGMDSLPKKRKRVLEMLFKATDELETADIAMEIGYPTNTTRRILEDLHGLGLANRQHEGKGYADNWSISDYTKNLLEKAKPDSLRAEKHEEKEKNESIPEMSGEVDELSKLFDEPESGTLTVSSDK